MPCSMSAMRSSSSSLRRRWPSVSILSGRAQISRSTSALLRCSTDSVSSRSCSGSRRMPGGIFAASLARTTSSSASIASILRCKRYVGTRPKSACFASAEPWRLTGCGRVAAAASILLRWTKSMRGPGWSADGTHSMPGGGLCAGVRFCCASGGAPMSSLAARLAALSMLESRTAARLARAWSVGFTPARCCTSRTPRTGLSDPLICELSAAVLDVAAGNPGLGPAFLWSAPTASGTSTWNVRTTGLTGPSSADSPATL
mmetsp:Transcript_4365/g.12583  ORF Transcript_4365/g.12583 Transcript_4365/m.12583 type:complete len:259 (-) Transcript_4365:306-1082(-)